ncbi:MAG: glycosyltransferase family 2 protein [Niabella sp.]|nr:glycosyltransferase family 2 protein [Niabella sp.]
MNEPVVSIIVPVYRVEQYLPQCIESIRMQSFTDFELLLINDGSPDGSGALCDAYAGTDHRIRVIHKENGGVSTSRNRGLQHARGTWITFIDSDDWIDRDYLSGLMAQTYDGAELIVGGYKIQSRRGALTCAPGYDRLYHKQEMACFYDDFIAASLVRTVWGGLYACAVIRQHRLRFDETMAIGEDTLFKFNYINAMKGPVVVVNSTGYNWRSVDGSASLSKKPNVEGWYKYIRLYYSALTVQFAETKRSIPVKNSLVADCCSAVFLLYSRGGVQWQQLAQAYALLSLASQKIDITPIKRKGHIMVLIAWLFKYSRATKVSHSFLRISFGLLKWKQRFSTERRRLTAQ